ncbi:hypothetical protein MLT67_12115 [Escherichia coli]|uniref:hypothetical protein n=1 Tax=Escherichia fergusonii TaxID=564 RepID=UPI0015E9110A|nr:hypothetical protein [Escherichia fergusonii]MBI1074437.1 hypothetical protein [Escherichia coli]MCN2350089.1 hypothetical protein [Escherichia coli]MCN2497775.1 hypothetical protein [Escherichia coli]QMC78155.1 hypothetical protein HVZ66_11180 [Escherichia fergusonii]HCO7573162.1 hypothetical protein [Escherichia fergusonii]
MTRIASPFAASGDKEQIPQTKQDTGEISFSEGYGPDYEKDLDNDTGAKTIERAKLNWLLCLVTSEIKKYQEQGIPDYISKEDNGGIDYSYTAAAMVRYNNKIYYSLKDANTEKPDTNSWSLLDPSEYLSVGGGTINGDLTIKGSLDINGEQPYTPTNPPPATPNSLAIGTVTTLEPGAPASAEITGDAPEQTLNIGIPAGAPGTNGDDGKNVTISSNGITFAPDDNGVITLGSVAGKNIAHDGDNAWESRLTIPEWTPAGSRFSVSASASVATVIDWNKFIFTAGSSYSISKESTNNPLAGKGKDDSVAWVVTCLSNSYLSTSQNGSFLIVREASKKNLNDVFILYRYQISSNTFTWAIGTIPMLAV